MWKSVTPANLFTLWGQWESKHFLIDFGVNFLAVGTPGGSRAPLAEQVLSQTDFVTSLGVPGMPCGVLVAPLGELGPALSDLGRHVGAKSSEERVKKKILVHTVCPSRL